MHKKKIIILSTIVTILLTGCSVKPQIILPSEVKEDVKNSLAELDRISQPVTQAITLDEAINRAIKNNLSKKVDILSSALAQQKIDIVAYESLPSLTAKGGYSVRDNYAASASTSFTDGRPEPLDGTQSYSVSQDKKSTTTGVAFSWNILDFGLSYVRAGQQANRFLIAKEKERKSIHNIKQEVRNAYYQAVSADELLKRIKPIMIETTQAFQDSKNIKRLELDAPIKSLTYQRELLEVIRSLNTLEENLVKSKIELSRLMGLKPGTKFELAEKIKEKYELPNVNVNVSELEKLALENRPELQETRYQEKISESEVKAVMLKMLPGINLNAGYSYDNSQYLLNNEWISYGASVSWNLLNVFNANLNNKLAKTQIELAKQQKLALSMAVLSQVHISLLDFHQAKKEYELSEEYFGVAKEIFNIIKNENALNVNGKLSLIKEKLNYLISNLRLSSSYAKVQNSYGKVISSIGNEKQFLLEESKVKIVKNEKTKAPIVKAQVETKVKTETIVDSKSSNSIARKYGIIKESANLRESSSLDSKVVRIYLKDEEIEILGLVKNNGMTWYKTQDGYIATDLVKIK